MEARNAHTVGLWRGLGAQRPLGTPPCFVSSHEGSCVIGGGEGPGPLEEKGCFRVCVAKAEE